MLSFWCYITGMLKNGRCSVLAEFFNTLQVKR